MKPTYYITTPIYYPSGDWHLGHCYTTTVCDAFARFKRMNGFDVFFLTGTDEHGQKIAKKAAEAGMEPKPFIDGLVDKLKDIWKMMDISYDKFIRTTDEEHVRCVQKIVEKLYEKGEIYKAEYEGWYCTPCESFWTESQLKDGKCPDCGREVTREKEESYFFRLSKYTDKILKLYEDQPDFLQPKSRVNEMINNFLKPGLTDLCISRTSFNWGIPVTFDKKHVVYVWIDALANYISALGYLSDDDSLFQKFWPADLHMTAKEIIRFHAIIWPAILMALDLPLPKQVYGHGWLLIGGDKMSKSKTDNIRTELVHPKALCDRYGSDAVRYFLLREIPFGSDGVYTNETLLKRINSDLANDLGNLVSRTQAMIGQYFGGTLPKIGLPSEEDAELISAAEGLYGKVSAAMDALNVPDALTEIFKVVQRANKYIDDTMPWAIAKDESKKARLATVLYNLSETIRIVAVMLKPYLTKAPDIILDSLGIDPASVTDFESVRTFGALPAGSTVKKTPPLFPRIDIPKELKEVEKIVLAEKQAEKKSQKSEPAKPAVHEHKEKAQIGIEDFDKVQLKVATVLAAEKVEKSDKLLKLRVKIGGEERTVVSGIQKAYAPEYLVGKQVVMVTNLKPVKLRGIESQGMIICAENEKGELSFLTPERDVGDGAEIF